MTARRDVLWTCGQFQCINYGMRLTSPDSARLPLDQAVGFWVSDKCYAHDYLQLSSDTSSWCTITRRVGEFELRAEMLKRNWLGVWLRTLGAAVVTRITGL